MLERPEVSDQLKAVSVRAGEASAMVLSLCLVESSKVDIWEAETAVWERRREALVMSSAFPSESARAANEITQLAYVESLPDMSLSNSSY